MIIGNMYVKSSIVRNMTFVEYRKSRDIYAKIWLMCGSLLEIKCTEKEYLFALRDLQKWEAANGKD